MYATMPSATMVARLWLKRSPAVTALVGDRISYRLGSVYPAIRLTRISTPERGPTEALVRVQVECFAADYDAADRVAAAVEASLGLARGVYAGLGECAGAAVLSGPFDNPDPDGQKYRQQLDVGLWLYPEEN